MNAKAAGIPVGVVDTGIDQVPEWGLDLWVGGGSEYNNGVRAGEIMGEAGVKSAVCVNQEVGNVALDDRCNGFKDGLAKTGGKIEVVAVTMDPTESAGRVEAFISAHPGTDGVLALGPSVADPILQRLKETGLIANIKMGTFDLSPVALEAVDKGEMLFAIDSQQYPDGLSAGRLLHHEGDVRDAADRQRDDRPGLHHEGPGRQRALARASRASGSSSDRGPAPGRLLLSRAEKTLGSRRSGRTPAAGFAADAIAASAGARGARRHAACRPRLRGFAGDTGLFSSRGIINVLQVSAELGILATAVALLMIGGEFDLSIGSIVGFAGVVIGLGVTEFHLPIELAVLIGFRVRGADRLRERASC